MKTENLFLYISLFTCLLACDVTDRIPEDAITDLNFWRKVDDLNMYTRTFYRIFPGPPYPGYYDMTSDIHVEIVPNNTLFDNRTVPTGSTGWAYSDWETIRRCNYFMTHYQTVEGDQEDIDHYVGENRFFRAYDYFNKVKRFGDVPWYEKDLNTNDHELLYKGRDPRLFVIGKIVEDLEFAASNMKIPSQVQSGQLHKYVAYHMLARVCLYEATWMKYRGIGGWEDLMRKAVSAAKAVMDSGLYNIVVGVSEYTMGPDYPLNYKGQFTVEDLTGNAECILPRVYIKDIAMHNLNRMGSYIGLSKDFIESFLDIEGMPIALSNVYLGDDSIHMELTNRDPRLRNIIIHRNLPNNVLDGVVRSVAYIVPGALTVTGDMNGTGYCSFKFQDIRPGQEDADQSTTDWHIFRYAETLLIYAEAKAELGEITQDDLDITINKLRERLDQPGQTMGRLSLDPPADPLALVNGEPRYGYAVSPLLYEIRRERLVELCFEGFRWDDICRWKAGKLIENPKTIYGMVINDDVIEQYTRYNNNTNPFANSNLVTINDWDKTKQLLLVYPPGTTRKWNDRLYLDPLPQTETSLNPNLLPQNPGW